MLDPHLLECNKCHGKIIKKKKKINDKQTNNQTRWFTKNKQTKREIAHKQKNKQTEESAHKQTNKQEDNLTKKFGSEYQKQVELHQR